MANQVPAAVAAAPTGLPPTTAARAFLARLSDATQVALSQRRPWSELVDRSSFAKPESLSEATSRVRKNWSHFRMNYMVFLTSVVALSLVWHPTSLLMLCVLLAAWIFLYLFRTQPLVLFNRTFSEKEVLVLMGVLSVVLVFMTEVGSLLISAVIIGLGIVFAHGAFRVPDDLFLDEQEPSGGFLSFLGTGPTQPPVSTHV